VKLIHNQRRLSSEKPNLPQQATMSWTLLTRIIDHKQFSIGVYRICVPQPELIAAFLLALSFLGSLPRVLKAPINSFAGGSALSSKFCFKTWSINPCQFALTGRKQPSDIE
jgi:hypothetical protein